MRILAVIDDKGSRQRLCLDVCCAVAWWGCDSRGGGLLHFSCSGKHDNNSTFTPTSVSVAALQVCVCAGFSVSQRVADASVRKWKYVFASLQMADNIQNEWTQNPDVLQRAGEAMMMVMVKVKVMVMMKVMAAAWDPQQRKPRVRCVGLIWRKESLTLKIKRSHQYWNLNKTPRRHASS